MNSLLAWKEHVNTDLNYSHPWSWNTDFSCWDLLAPDFQGGRLLEK